MDDADFAADMAERERQALIQRHLRRLPPPVQPERQPTHLRQVMDRDTEEAGK